jgi:hypothetical protein
MAGVFKETWREDRGWLAARVIMQSDNSLHRKVKLHLRQSKNGVCSMHISESNDQLSQNYSAHIVLGTCKSADRCVG